MADQPISTDASLPAGSIAVGDLVPVVDISEPAAADKNKNVTFTALTTYFQSNLTHSGFSDYVGNEHIDWTNATQNFLTSSTITSASITTSGAIGKPVNSSALSLYGGLTSEAVNQSGLVIYGSTYSGRANDIALLGASFQELLLWDNDASKWIFSYPVSVDTINEKTAAAGVTIDGVLIKDGLVDGKDVSTFREPLTANRTYYVRTDGNDSTNDGLTDSAGGAFLTIQKAIDVCADTLDFRGYTVTVQVGAGTYTGTTVIATPMTGQALASDFYILGDTTTPTNVLISTTSNNCFSISGEGVRCKVAGFEVRTTTTGDCFSSAYGAYVELGAMNYGVSAGIHISVTGDSYVNPYANYTVSGNAAYHIVVNRMSVVQQEPGITVTFSGTPTFSTAYVYVVSNSYFKPTANYSGTFVGSRFIVEYAGIIATSALAQTVFPGTIAGTISGTGAWDNQTTIVGITGTKAQFDTAVTDGDFAYSGGAFHDGFSDFLSNEHIDWTNATVSLSTSQTVAASNLTATASITAATSFLGNSNFKLTSVWLAGPYAPSLQFDTNDYLYFYSNTYNFMIGSSNVLSINSTAADFQSINIATNGTSDLGGTVYFANSGLTTQNTFRATAYSTTLPALEFDTNDYISYDRATNGMLFNAGNVLGFAVGSTNISCFTTFFIKERAAAIASIGTWGQLWVKNTNPCTLWWTNDAGTPTQIV